MGKNLTIYRAGNPLFDLVERGRRTVSNASINKTLLSDDSVSIAVVSDSELDLKINDTVELYGKTYRINTLPSVNKLNSRRYEYDIKAEGLMYDLLRCKFFNADGTGTKFETEFPLIGTIETFLICIKNNMHRFASEWEIGTFSNGETKTITFGSDDCLSALQKICQEFKTDFWIKTENGKFVINTGDFGNTIPITFEYGKGKGLYSLTRQSVDDTKVINRLIANGGTNNIKAGYRNYSTRLKLPAAEYIEDAALIDSMGLREGEQNFDEIYPKRTGKITTLGDTKFKFSDSSMDFDLNEKEADGITTKYLIPGTSAKVHFNTGNLAGYEFEIKKGGYNHTTKEFEIIPFKNDKDQSFPDKDSAAFQFEIGDEYVLLNIVMPDIYVSNAENELLDKAKEQFTLLKQAKVSYGLEIDPEYIKGLTLDQMDIGDYIRVVDEPLGIDKILRINSITRNFIQNGEVHDYDVKVTIADSYEIDYNSKLIIEIKDIKNVLSITKLGKINLSRIGVKTTEELKNLIFDTDGYFDPDNIRPNSIETNMLTVGSRSQQISCSVLFNINYEGDKNKVKVSPGLLYSQTFDKTWNIPGFTFIVPDDQYRYIYGKCSKGDSSASIVFTQEKIKFDEDPSYYYFLIGILHSVVEGLRVLSPTVGTTTINGGLVRTGVISSLDGSTYFDLENNKIKGNIEFEINSPAFQQVLNHIQFGSRNILRHSDFKSTDNYYAFWAYGVNASIYNESGAMKLISNENKSAVTMGLACRVLAIDFSSLKDKLMTLSFKVKSNSLKKLYADVFSNQGIQSIINRDIVNVNDSWTKISITFRTNNVDYNDFFFYCFGESFLTGEAIWLKEPVLEWGNIASDWSPAPEDVQETLDIANQNANAAKTAAQNAQTSANTANALLSDISNDDKLTSGEKYKLKTEWDTIQGEKSVIIAQAVNYNLSHMDYDDGYNELETYINSSEIFTDFSVTTNVNGDYFRDTFANYYQQKVQLLKLVSDKAKQLADTAQNTANQAGQAALNAQNGVNNLQSSMNDVKTKTDNFLSINGGLLMGNILSVGDNQLNQRAFLSGVTDSGDTTGTSVRFAAGANYVNKNTAPFRVQDNGKMYATDAEITGKITATSGTFTGTVYAQSGKFGDTTGSTYFSISSKGLESINGWIAVGDFSGAGNNKKYAQLVADSSGSAILSIVNAKNDNIFHTGISLDIRNGTGGNIALDIPNGGIRVQNKEGVTGKITPPIDPIKMEFINGIFVGFTV